MPPLPGWIVHGASFCAGAAAAAAVLLVSEPIRDTTNGDGHGGTKDLALRPSPASDDVSSYSVPAKMLPTINVRLFQPNDSLTIAFDTRSKNPLFVVERLSAASMKKPHPSPNGVDATAIANRKNKRFREESTLLPYHRSRNHQYRNSGYDRGHLAPAADFASNDCATNDTFALTNVSPQWPRFNRTMWLRLEEFVRDVAKREGEGKETWVVTGPLWLPNSVTKSESGDDRFWYYYEGIGRPPSLVAVPTHFYKVVAVVRRMSEAEEQSAPSASATIEESTDHTLEKFAAFVLPNSDLAGESNGMRLIDHAVRLTDLEAVTGLEFFAALFGVVRERSGGRGTEDIPLRKEIADALTDDVRFNHKVGNQSTRGTEGNSGALVPFSEGDKWSKGRRRRVRQILSENAPVSFWHLCQKNDACFRLRSV